MSVGGAAASGLQSGFDLGLRANAAEDARQQRAFENQRQTNADARQASLDSTNATRQATQDANAEDDRALTGLNSQMDDARFQLGALHAKYPTGQVPDAEAKPLYTQAQQIHDQRSQLIAKRYQPVIDKTTQKWRDFSSQAQAGNADPSSLRGDDLREYIKATTGHDLTDFNNGTIGKSISDATAGLGSGNMPMVVDAAGTLLAPQLRKGLGGVAPDGSQIVDKSLYALVPAPAPNLQQDQQSPVQGLMGALNAATGGPQAQQPQQTPQQSNASSGLVMPVLQVSTRQPDGSITTYHAPVTDGRGAGPDDAISGPLKTSDLMDRMGRLGVVDNWLKTPQMQQAVQEALKSSTPTTFDQAWAAVHGDPKVLNGTNLTDATSLKIRAIKKLADEQYGGDFSAASQALAGKVNVPASGAAVTPGAPAPAPGAPAPAASGLAGGVPAKTDVAGTKAAGLAQNPPAGQAARDSDRTAILQGEIVKSQTALDAAKKAGDPAEITRKQGDLDAANRELANLNKPLAGGAAPAAAPGALPASTVLGAPPSAKSADQKTVDFYAAADIAGDRNWRVGLARSKSGAQLIEDVKRRIPQLAEEWGITPQDYGTIVGQRAALGATLKQITSRVTANEMSADKVSRDMQTYESLIDGASSDYGAAFINKPINALRRQFNDPKLAQLDLAANQVGTEYERMLQGGQLSVAGLHAGAAEDAKKLVNGDLPPAAARATMQIMVREIQNAKDASHASLDSVTERMRTLGRGNQGPASGLASGGGPTGAPAPAPAPAPAAGKFVEGQTYTDGKGQKARYVGGKWVPL